MEQLKSNYHFGEYEDLTNTAHPFIEQLQSMSEQIAKLDRFGGYGEIITEANEAIIKQRETHQTANQHYVEEMAAVAKAYTDLIAEMRSQELTVYYEIDEGITQD